MKEAVSLDNQHINSIINLLNSHGLPIQDIDLDKQIFWGIFDDKSLVACGGTEILGNSGLLRSLAVDRNYQNQGLGKVIYEQIIDHAVIVNLKSLYLLTTTASEYFNKKGFKIIERHNVPEKLLNTEEFKSLCPASAICMQLDINKL